MRRWPAERGCLAWGMVFSVAAGWSKESGSGMRSSVLTVLCIIAVFSCWDNLQNRLQCYRNKINAQVKFYAQLFFRSKETL